MEFKFREIEFDGFGAPNPLYAGLRFKGRKYKN
jgi:hypothetical protein